MPDLHNTDHWPLKDVTVEFPSQDTVSNRDLAERPGPVEIEHLGPMRISEHGEENDCDDEHHRCQKNTSRYDGS